MIIHIDQQQLAELNQQHTELLQRFHGATKSDTMTITFEDGFRLEIFGYIDASPERADIYTNEQGHDLYWQSIERYGDSISCIFDGNHIDLNKNMYIHVERKWWQRWLF